MKGKMASDRLRGEHRLRHGNRLLTTIASLVLIAAVCSQTAESAPPVQPPAPGAAAEYVIGAGDMLSVVVAQNPDLSADNVPVRPDGKISTPLSNDVVAVGQTPTQLAREIESRLKEFVRAPNVTVIVRTAVGELGQVKVIGNGVVTPKAFPYHSGMRVLDLVVSAGGLSQFAAGNRSKLVRTNADGSTHEIKVRLDDLMRRGAVTENILLQPGDILVVPESWF